MRHKSASDLVRDISQVMKTRIFSPLFKPDLQTRCTDTLMGTDFPLWPESAAEDGVNKEASGWLLGLGVNCTLTSVYNLKAA